MTILKRLGLIANLLFPSGSTLLAQSPNFADVTINPKDIERLEMKFEKGGEVTFRIIQPRDWVITSIVLSPEAALNPGLIGVLRSCENYALQVQSAIPDLNPTYSRRLKIFADPGFTAVDSTNPWHLSVRIDKDFAQSVRCEIKL